MTTSTLVTIGIVVIVCAGVGYGIYRIVGLLPGGKVAETQAGAMAPHAFELRFVTTATRTYRLAARVRMASIGGLASWKTDLGVVCHLEVHVGDRLLSKERVGIGGTFPEHPTRVATTAYFGSTVESGGDITSVATYVLDKLPEVGPGVEVVATGSFVTANGTDLSSATIFLGR